MSNKSFIVSAASNSFAPSLDYVVTTKIWEKFDESCLIQQKLTFYSRRSGEYLYCLWDKCVATTGWLC